MDKKDMFFNVTDVKWMEGDAEYGDIVMSTRIRLARNLKDYRFPRAFSDDEAFKLDQTISNVLLDAETLDQNFTYIDISTTPILQKKVLVEKHLISPQLAHKERSASVVISDDESVSVMINEEDHLRIQCMEPGLDLEKAYFNADTLDRYLEEHVPYAFDEEFGYLTSCPTNTGTGMRASVMMHLPALTMTDQMEQIISMMPRLGMVVRGIYGEGTEAVGNYYQISNQVTLGKSEEEILTDLQSLAEQIVQREAESRKALLAHAATIMNDRVNRSLGTLHYARILASDEAANCLSNVRLGIDLGLIENIPTKVLNKCMLVIQPGFLQQYVGTTLKPNERDVYRATLLREILNNVRQREKGDDSYDV
ncbi:protein arginine kinase [Kurthia huakuii]|uniref:protein arginine kinase n=1 Tax=Kurthia huakuii TaxID=1421019 RepID=UPI000496A1FA|nr:protein arginine kinase [Kurthia huakuii]MBM7699854.1 protein arginine kinase [Kurthia huakuii]